MYTFLFLHTDKENINMKNIIKTYLNDIRYLLTY